MPRGNWFLPLCLTLLLGWASTDAAVAFQTASGSDNDWRSIRGSDGTGRTNPKGILSQNKKIDLKVRWRVPIGSGYSSVVVADNKAVTLYSKPDGDRAICVDAKTGKTVWDVKIDKMYKGENGSFDGPISTPLIHGNQVFALTPYGKLHAIDFSNGEIQWTYDAASKGHKVPMYGFSTCPIMADGTVVVQFGGKDTTTVGFNPADGTVRWKTGHQLINSQIPTVLKIDGKEIVLAFGGVSRGESELQGIDPKTGKSLFKHKVTCGNGSAVMPSVADDNLIILTVDDRFSKAVTVEKSGDDYVVSDTWKNRSIKNTYNVPVVCDDYIYAFSTRFLTCVDPEDGEAVWKDRNPGDGFVISVDDHLIVSTKRGGIYIAKPSDEEFSPIAENQTFGDLVWSIPSYSDNAVFQRSLKELVRIDIVSTDSVAAAENDDELPLGVKFAELVKKTEELKGRQEQQKAIEQFVGTQKKLPYIEDSVAHFLFQSADKTGKSDVALACDVFGARQEKKMRQIGSTNWFYYTLKLPENQRMNYVYLDNYQLKTDPRNPRKATSSLYAGEMEFAVRLRGVAPLEMSWFGMNKWVKPTFLESAKSGSGSFEEFQYKAWKKGAKGPGGRPLPKPVVEVFLPKGYQDSEKSYPTIYLHDGTGGKKLGGLENACNNLLSGDNAAILVSIPMGITGKELAEVLVPAVDKKYRTKKSPANRSSIGFGFASDSAIITGLSYPKVFGRTSIQSSLAFDDSRRQIVGLLQKLDSPVKLQIIWGNYDMNNPVENWDVRKISKTIFQAAKGTKLVELKGGTVNDTTDWSSWRNRWDRVFQFALEK